MPIKIKSLLATKKTVNGYVKFLNIGCSSKPVNQEWLHLDLMGEHADGVMAHDCRFPLPFADNQFEGVFSEHFLEHLEYSYEALNFVKEVFRVLKKGGVFRVIVPDCGAYFFAYAKEGDRDVEKLRGCVNGRDPWFGVHYQTKMELLNVVIRQGSEHKFCYDKETLELLLRRAGFRDIKQMPCNDGIRKELLIDRADRVSESLRIEAVK